MILKITKSILLFQIIVLTQCSSRVVNIDHSPMPMKSVVDNYYGISINDPYRPLENLADSSVQKWMKMESNNARQTLNRITGRDMLINKMIDFDKRLTESVYRAIITDNDRYFYLKILPADQTGKLYYRDGFTGTEHLLFDPVKYGTDTTKKYVISSFSPSHDGSKIAFDVASNGSESSELLVMNVENRTLYPEKIDRCWYPSPSWLPDNKRFFFTRLQSSDVLDQKHEIDSKAYLHTVGSDPASDRIVLSREAYPGLGIEPHDIPVVYYDKECNFLFAQLKTVDNRVNAFYAPATETDSSKIAWKRLFTPSDDVYYFLTSANKCYIFTPKDAPNYKIVEVPLENPDMANAKTVVAEDPQQKLDYYGITSEGIYYVLSKNGVERKLFFHPYDGQKSTEIKLPVPAGSLWIYTKGPRFCDIWIGVNGWKSDYQRYRYLSSHGEFKPENLSTIAEYPEYADLIVEELMVPSSDSVLVPLSLIYKKGLKKNSLNPVFLSGYGAYGYSLYPSFSPQKLLWTLQGGILAYAHVRGGGELGNKWYKDGFKTTKANTWNDMIYCAEYLIGHKYSSPAKMVINGRSAGGITVGRAMTERPDLFAAVIPEVGLLNPLRVEESPNGPINIPEFGTVKDSVECMALLAMDSYCHLKDGVKYPATLITAGINDPRVIAWQPAKFAARLQAATSSNKPVLFFLDFETGHGFGNTKLKNYENIADAFSFALWQTGHPDFSIH
jgi:prolyl oligopeptidase